MSLRSQFKVPAHHWIPFKFYFYTSVESGTSSFVFSHSEQATTASATLAFAFSFSFLQDISQPEEALCSSYSVEILLIPTARLQCASYSSSGVFSIASRPASKTPILHSRRPASYALCWCWVLFNHHHYLNLIEVFLVLPTLSEKTGFFFVNPVETRGLRVRPGFVQPLPIPAYHDSTNDVHSPSATRPS